MGCRRSAPNPKFLPQLYDMVYDLWRPLVARRGGGGRILNHMVACEGLLQSKQKLPEVKISRKYPFFG